MCNKVFCGECKWYKSLLRRTGIYHLCKHDSNTTEVVTFKEIRSVQIKPANKLNKYNDCQNFKNKRWYNS